MKKFILLCYVLFFCSAVIAQNDPLNGDDSVKSVCSKKSLDIGSGINGISFGNSSRWNGLRFNFSDCGIETINGINITFWNPGRNPYSTVNGLAAGLAPGAAKMRGLSLGLAAVVATEELCGLNIGGLAVVSAGSSKGVNIGGLAVVSDGDLTGINFGGLAVVSNGQASGFNFGGLAVVCDKDLYGFNIGGLAAVSNGMLRGINLGGLAVVSNSSMTGINFGGLAVVANGDLAGINIGGAAVVGAGNITGLSAAIGAIVSRGIIKGINAAGYKTEAEEFKGFNIACGWSEITDLKGISISGYNRITGTQTGLVIGLFNSADVLNGVQIGILNIAENNSGIAKILPFFNFHFE
jgi:hypothetical protein